MNTEWQQIASFVDIPSLLSLRQTSRAFLNLIDRDDTLWHSLVLRDFPRKNYASNPYAMRHREALEQLAVHSSPLTPSKKLYIVKYINYKCSSLHTELLFNKAFNYILAHGDLASACLALPFILFYTLNFFSPALYTRFVAQPSLYLLLSLFSCAKMNRLMFQHAHKVLFVSINSINISRYRILQNAKYYPKFFFLHPLSTFSSIGSCTAFTHFFLTPLSFFFTLPQDLWLHVFLIFFSFYTITMIKPILPLILFNVFMLFLWLCGVPFLFRAAILVSLILLHPLFFYINCKPFQTREANLPLPTSSSHFFRTLLVAQGVILPLLSVYPLLQEDLTGIRRFICFVAFIVPAIIITNFNLYKLLCLDDYRVWGWLSFLVPTCSTTLWQLLQLKNITLMNVVIAYCNASAIGSFSYHISESWLISHQRGHALLDAGAKLKNDFYVTQFTSLKFHIFSYFILYLLPFSLY